MASRGLNTYYKQKLVEKAIRGVFHGQVHIESPKLLFVFPRISQTIATQTSHKQSRRSLDMNTNYMQSNFIVPNCFVFPSDASVFLSPWRCGNDFMIPMLFMLTRCFMKAFYDFTISSVVKAAFINVIQRQSSPNSFLRSV
jgi:hypothetical protein